MRNAGSVRQPCGLSAHALGAALVLAGASAGMPAQAQSTATPTPPVREVSSKVLALDPSRGSGVYPVYASSDLQAGSAAGRLAFVVVHGRLRNASDYFITGTQLAATAGAKAPGGGSTATIVVAPQFLNQVRRDKITLQPHGQLHHREFRDVSLSHDDTPGGGRGALRRDQYMEIRIKGPAAICRRSRRDRHDFCGAGYHVVVGR
jgi:hypothetical protein